MGYLSKIKGNAVKAIKNPDKAYNYASRILKQIIPNLVYNYYFIRCPEPKKKGGVPFTDESVEREVISELKKEGYSLLDFNIEKDDYREFVLKAGYDKFLDVYGKDNQDRIFNKSLQHYLAAKLLNLSQEDVYVDIACAASPASYIYQKIYGCKVYKQDLGAPEGIHGNLIGGDAGSMPVRDGFFTKMGLHCSLEHFENDSDINFIKEAGRVLKKGGKLCIVPLYIFNKYALLSSPSYMIKNNVLPEKDAIIYYQGYGNGYIRFYDVSHLTTRIRNNLNGLKLTTYVIQNGKDVDPSCWVRFVAIFEKE